MPTRTEAREVALGLRRAVERRECSGLETAREPVTNATNGTRILGRSLEHWILLGIGVLGLALIAVLGVWVEPDPRGVGTHERLGLPACKPMEWWNVPCPGCGVTTSLALLAHGEPRASFLNQPFGFAMSVLLAVYGLWAIAWALRGRDLYQSLRALPLGKPMIALGVLMLVSWVYKLAQVRHWFDGV